MAKREISFEDAENMFMDEETNTYPFISMTSDYGKPIFFSDVNVVNEDYEDEPNKVTESPTPQKVYSDDGTILLDRVKFKCAHIVTKEEDKKVTIFMNYMYFVDLKDFNCFLKYLNAISKDYELEFIMGPVAGELFSMFDLLPLLNFIVQNENVKVTLNFSCDIFAVLSFLLCKKKGHNPHFYTELCLNDNQWKYEGAEYLKNVIVETFMSNGILLPDDKEAFLNGSGVYLDSDEFYQRLNG